MRDFRILAALLLLLGPISALADPETTYQSTSTTTVIITLSSLTAWNTVTVTGSPPTTTTSCSTTALASSSGSSTAVVQAAATTPQTYPYSSGNLTSNGTGNAQPSGSVLPLLFPGSADSNHGSFALSMLAGCVVAALGAVL